MLYPQQRARTDTLATDLDALQLAHAAALRDAQAQFVDHVHQLAKLELRTCALQERLDRVEAERLRVRIRERRAEGVVGGGGAGSPSAAR